MYDLAWVSVTRPLNRRSDVDCQTLQYRIASLLVRACAFGTSRPRGRAPRSFSNVVSLLSPCDLLFSCVFVILQIFLSVDPVEYSLLRNCEPQRRAS